MEKAVFEVLDVPFDLAAAERGDISTFSAEEYLAWVVYQASAIPDVVRIESTANDVSDIPAPVTVDFSKPPTKELEHLSPLAPCKEWEAEFLLRFQSLRDRLSALSEQTFERKVPVPAMKNIAGWLLFCLGEKHSLESREEQGGTDEDAGDDGDIEQALKRRKQELPPAVDAAAAASTSAWNGEQAVKPAVALLLQFDQVLTQRLLAMHVDWLLMKPLSSMSGVWLLGLLARCETPLCRDTVSNIRALYRRCTELRSQCGAEEQDEMEQRAMLNILICISGKYFGQGEEYST